MRFLQTLLWLYPAAFRNEYGDDMLDNAGRRLRDARAPLARFGVAIELALDFLITAWQTHIDILRQDVSYCIRSLLRARGFTATAIAVIGLGIGVTTAVFSLADHVLLRPLPFPESGRLVKLWEDQVLKGYRRNEPSPANYRDWKRMSKSFEAMAAYRSLSVNMQGQGDPERVDGVAMNADVFPMLGAKPILGRLFDASDDREGAPGTVVLSYSYWRNRFGGDPSVVGRKVIFDDGPNTIVGVMPPDFHFPYRDTQFWAPMRFAEADFQDRENNYLHVIAKLKPGVSLKDASAEMQVIASNLERQYPKENQKIGVAMMPFRDNLSQRSRDMVMTLMAASACILLIVCMNLASLLTARSFARSKEIAVRSALGAGRERMIRQVLTESLVLAVAGGIAGILVATWTMPLLRRFVPDSLPIAASLGLNTRVLLFSLACTLLTGLGFGLLPALRSQKSGDLREGARQAIGGRKAGLWSAIVMVEIAASIVLLVCSGLLIRAFWNLQSIDPGFRAEGVLTMRTSLPMPRYVRTQARVDFYARVLSEVRRLPNVMSAGYVSFLPLVFRGGIHPVEVTGSVQVDKPFHDAYLRFVTPGYLSAMGISLLSGRDINDSDTSKTEPVVVVSENFVNQHWPGQNAIGRVIDFASAKRRIVGVVRTVRFRDLERERTAQVYVAATQIPDDYYTWFAPKDLAIRVSGKISPTELATSIRRIVSVVDPAQPVSDIQTLEEIVSTETAPRRVQMWLTGTFAAIAFLLAAMGIHGMLSFAVSQRIQEIGVRIALGADRAKIVSLVLGHSASVCTIGTIAGLGMAALSGYWIRSLLVGVPPADPVTFVTAILLCFAMTFAGSLLPAVRAIRVDPITAIRAE